MPYVVEKDQSGHCSSSKPWATKNQQTNEILGCHSSKQGALAQSAALYANTSDASASESDAEDQHMKTDAENRAKYTQQQIDELGAASKAFKSVDGTYSYPIDNTADVADAVRAVGRGGASYNAIRQFVSKRARSLGVSDRVPDSWNSDGSLEGKAMYENAETRETYNDLMTALSSAVQDLVGDGWYAWVQDFDQESVYFQASGSLYACPYTVEAGGPITLGEPERVRPVTSYVPADGERSGDWLAYEQRRKQTAPERAEEARADQVECPTCNGSGKIRGGKVECPDCGGTGKVDADEEKSEPRRLATRTLEWRRERAPHRGDRESRQVTAPLELREEDGGDTWVLRSYASLFNQPYTVGSGSYRYEESVMPGAFKRTLGNGPDIVFRAEHGGPPLARTSSGTLTVGEDETGLWYEAALLRTDPDVQRLVPKIQRKDLSESSFAFRCVEDEWDAEFSKRSLRQCDLDRGDVSVVTFGASRATGRHMLLRSEEEAVQALRSAGLEAFITAWLEWRDYTLVPVEERAGKALSAATTGTLKHALSLFATADEAVDEGQAVLADLLGVPNPDTDDGSAEPEAGSGTVEENAAEPVEEERAAPSPKPPTSIHSLRRELRGRGKVA